MKYNKKIDFHAHILTPSYYAYLDKYEGPTPDNFATPKWDEKEHIKLMDSLGVAYSEMSVSSPHIIKASGDERIDIINAMNEEALEVVSHHPDRLGLFATLPLPDVDAAIRSAEALLERDGVDGIGVTTHYDGMYLGSDKLDPLMEYLDSVGAVVCVHPTMPASLPGDAVLDMPIPIMDFLMDTTRAFTNMVWNDKFLKYPNIKWIWPHGGSFLNILSDSFESFAVLGRRDTGKKLEFFGALQHCWFDTAGFSAPKQLHCMKMDIPADHLLYGSDCPYTPSIACKALAGQLEDSKELTSKEKTMLFTTNGYALNPGLKKKLSGTSFPAARSATRGALGKAMGANTIIQKKRQ